MVTPEDIEHYLLAYGAQQGRDAMREDYERWARQLRERGLGAVPLTLGSKSAQAVDQMVNQWLVKHRPTPQIRQQAHDIRDTMPELRRFKGR